MGDKRRIARMAVVLVSVLCLVTFYFGNALTWGYSRAYAFQPFSTVPPVDATFPTPIGGLTPIPTPLPTIGPGQSFEEGDPYLDRIDEQGVVGDTDYGYYQIPEEPDLYLIWTTDRDGTRHYLVVDGESDVLTGGTNPDHGFFQLVDRREELEAANSLARENGDRQTKSAWFLTGGGVLAWAGAIGCVLASAGACVLALLGIGSAVVVASIVQNTNAGLQDNIIESNNGVIEDIEGELRFQLRIGQTTGGSG